MEQSINKLLRPLSPVTPPLPDPSLSPHLATPSSSVPGEEEGRGSCGVIFSPIPSLAASRCNTPLQFELCVRTDHDVPKAGSADASASSCPERPSLLPPGPSDPTSQPSETSFPGRSGEAQALLQSSEQASRTEFNLMYAFSPLNAMPRAEALLRESPLLADGKPLNPERGGCGSPVEGYFGRHEPALLKEVVHGSLAPCGERSCEGSKSTPQNPPQRKKVSLLEYRKRKQEAKEGVDPARCTGTPTRLGSSSSGAEVEAGLGTGSGARTLSSPQHGFSPSHSSLSHLEEVVPPEPRGTTHCKSQDSLSSRWMVPTSVERLREGRGILEKVLRSSAKICQRGDPSPTRDSIGERESDGVEGDSVDPLSSSLKGPAPVYSPSRYSYQLLQSDSPRAEQASLLQSSSSPYRGHPAPSPGYNYRPQSQRGAAAHLPPPGSSEPSLSSAPSSSTDSSALFAGNSGYHGTSQQQYPGPGMLKKSCPPAAAPSPAQTGAADSLSSSEAGSYPCVGTAGCTPTSSSSSSSSSSSLSSCRPSQSDLRTINPPASAPPALYPSPRGAALSDSQHYSHRGGGSGGGGGGGGGGSIHPYRLQPLPGSGVKTQTGLS
ncbi:hypothetical protein JRQ81_003325 [Phrynocephalus forsythii]|uniref:Uncharacterized protein n=1 Tax=Phrynocephalus forsythii TaxID=171643 RepID=A0A9Q0XJM0_9SAUR|nr:hypothetical protein JRQ81_003325 [Phrynocephalus forsythii]